VGGIRILAGAAKTYNRRAEVVEVERRTALRCARLGALMLAAAVFAACSATRPAPSAPSAAAPANGASIVGIASWYGPGFNGHRTSSGAIYDQDDLTAASTAFPLGSRVRVTNLDNGKSVDVTINDHGPYVKGRKLDLSRRAARQIGMIGTGTAPVRMAVLETPAGGPALGERYFVQVGSFADPAHAESVRKRLAAHYDDVEIQPVRDGFGRFYRVRMGAFASREDAAARAARMVRSGFPAFVITE
jgi:rare lipoprotein A